MLALLPALVALTVGCDMAATPLVPPASPTAPIVTATAPVELGGAEQAAGDPGAVNADTVAGPSTDGAGDLDATLPAWTVMVYSSADHPAWRYTFDALNQMEAAGASGQVQVVAAVDWPVGSEPVGSLPARYVIRGNNDPSVITSEEAIGADETNFGDPQLLSDFIIWAQEAYPANRYAVILDGYGAGWAGCCLDADPGDATADVLSPAEITAALQQANEARESPQPLDVVAFSGSLMGQLEVMQALAPHARYAVASAAPVPAAGWDYQAILGALYANPWQDGRQLAGLMASEYVAYHRDLLGNEFVAMTAVDLATVPALTTAVETLALLLAGDPLVGSGAPADARRGAQRYGNVLADLNEPVTTVDLGHAAALLAATSPSADVAVAARAVEVALDEAIVMQAAGQGLPWAVGPAIYWPATPGALDESYAAATPLANWSTFLAAFTSQTGTVPAPAVNMTAVTGDTAGQTSPLLLRAEVFGRQLDHLHLLITQESEGEPLLVRLDTPAPPVLEPTAETPGATVWPDGRHADTFTWDAAAGYLYDSAGAASAALLRAVDPSPAGGLVGVSGDLARAGDAAALNAVLEFPQSNPVPAHVWHLADAGVGAALVHEVPAGTGDRFTARLFRAAGTNAWQAAAGEPLTFDDVPTLYRSTRPLDNGDYTVSLTAATLGEAVASAAVPVTVNQRGVEPGFLIHTESELGLAFAFPEGWAQLVREGTTLSTSDAAAETTLQVRVVDPWLADAAALRDDALSTLGGVTVLFQDTTVAGNDPPVPAARLDYGYTDDAGRLHTGILIAFALDGRGYIIDLDGLQTAEAELLTTANTVAASWRFLPGVNAQLSDWPLAILGGYDVHYPPGMTFEDINGWYRFVRDDNFIAIRVQPSTRSAEEAVAALLAAAGEGVEGFEVVSSGPLFLGGALWQQGNFAYRNETGTPIAGTILTRPDMDSELAVWSEWPQDDGAARAEAVALAMAASMTLHTESVPAN